MNIDSSRVQDLIDHPSESLAVELKRWIDPSTESGKKKIVTAVLALRNYNGGYLVIGFDNETLQPDRENIPQDVPATFHIDKLQGFVTRFSSEPFEVSVEFPERDGQRHPVIVVPSGVKTPVASKSELKDSGKVIIAIGDIYVRTLQSNNTVSTAKAQWKDWPALMEVCFDNREADIGRFFRRHLSSMKPEALRELISAIAQGGAQETSAEDDLKKILATGNERFQMIMNERIGTNVPEHGSWEIAMLIRGDVPEHLMDHKFLNLLNVNNPRLTGWPIWLDSSGFADEKMRPYPFRDVWESFIVSLESWGGAHVDFMRLDPQGQFYLYRALKEDIQSGQEELTPLTRFDFDLPMLCVAEALAVGISFAKAMGCNPERTVLGFAFRWTKLKGRELCTWTNPHRDILPRQRAYQDDVHVFVELSLDTPLSALGEHVFKVVQPLYAAFNGFPIAKEIVEDLTRRLVEKRL